MKLFVLKYVSVIAFCTGVLLLFRFLNRVHPYFYIDEAFHIPQVLRYCAGNFTEWDAKITTLPGLYLVTFLILKPLTQCSITSIRFINVLGTFANFYLICCILKKKSVIEKRQKWSDIIKLLVTYNITLFPPLFFWFFLYYTDVLSVCTVMLMLLLHLHKSFKLAACVGILSVLVRQTNIVWLGFLIIECTLDILETKISKEVAMKQPNSIIHVKILWKQIVGEISRGLLSFIKFIFEICIGLLPYLIVCILFIAFVFWNKGIVVGDRTAHIATIHMPQLFYFSIFAFGFSWPYAIVHWRKYFRFIQKHWILTGCFFVISTGIVRSNTLVHPYVLADNRHYVFYVWNKFMGRYLIVRYLLIFVYSFTIYTTWCCINHLRVLTQINYILIVSAVLIPQLLLEPRYFIIPYIFYRLNIKKPKEWQIVAETLTTLLINFLQFFIFTNKVFYWEDQPYPQRISW